MAAALMKILKWPTTKKQDAREPERQLPRTREEQGSWLRRGAERRKPENAFIRRWFNLAYRVLGRKPDSDKIE